MGKPIWAGFLSVIVLALICAGIYAFSERADVAKATLSQVITIVGVDTNTTSNGATQLGTIDRPTDRCVAITSTGTFYIDLFVKDVTDLWSWDGTLSFDESVVAVNSLAVNGYFLGSNNYPFLDCSAGDQCLVSNLDKSYAGHNGSGVLGRLALTPVEVGATTKTSKLYFTWGIYGKSGVTLLDGSTSHVAIGDLDGDQFFDGLVFNAMVVVGTNATCPTDADKDGFTNVEESVDGSDLLDAASTPEMCDNVDNDLDGVTDEWYDRNPANGTADCVDDDADSDGDTTYNPDDSDDDNDGYTDAREAYLATDSLANCFGHPYHGGRPYPYHSAWPLDINNDGVLNLVGDVANYVGKIGSAKGDGVFRQRLDLNGNGAISLTTDVALYVGHIGDTCS
jgi:hypothetical protein